MGQIRVLQVGLDRCGTASLWKLFEDSGYKCCHCVDIHHFRGSVLQKIRNNLKEGHLPLSGLDDIQFYSDLKTFDREYDVRSRVYYGLDVFPIIAKAYPNAKFILNTRPVDHWLKSRLSGIYLEGTDEESGLLEMSKNYGFTTVDELKDCLQNYYFEHNAAIREFFRHHNPNQLVEFDIEKDSINPVIDFVKPEFQLKKEHWKHHHKTKT